MMKRKTTHSVDYNQWLKVWTLKLMNQPIKSPKILSQRISFKKNFEDWFNKQATAQCPLPPYENGR